MTMPPFPADALELPDYDLGGLLLGWFIAAQSDELGIEINRIPVDFAELVRQHVLTLDTDRAKNAALEKALHKAARGDFEAAGKFLREHMLSGAVALKFIPIGVKFTKGRKKNTGSPIRKAIARELNKNPALKPRQIWGILASKPPKRWEFFENSAGKYIEGPKGGEGMGYARFSEVCKEESDKLAP